MKLLLSTLLTSLAIPFATSLDYASGDCLQKAYNDYIGDDNTDLSCTAQDVEASLSHWECLDGCEDHPTNVGSVTCQEGSTIKVNLFLQLLFKSDTYDFTTYTSSSGASALDDPVCAMRAVSSLDRNLYKQRGGRCHNDCIGCTGCEYPGYPGVLDPNSCTGCSTVEADLLQCDIDCDVIQPRDDDGPDGASDTCFDIEVPSGRTQVTAEKYPLRMNFEIACTSAGGAVGDSVQVGNCFAWTNSNSGQDCDDIGHGLPDPPNSVSN